MPALADVVGIESLDLGESSRYTALVHQELAPYEPGIGELEEPLASGDTP